MPEKPFQRTTVRAPSGQYHVLCGRGLIKRAGWHIAGLGEWTGVFVLSSHRVWKYWGTAIESSLHRLGKVNVILFDDRESSKTMQTAERICRQLVRHGADRGALVVAAGGGVVGDVAGFVAATYLRGVALVHIPTTLVAQVDSAIGGKTGVNLPAGKNLVGAFYQPHLVLADPAVLSTLPPREYRSGLYEVVKYGVIADAVLFRALERNLEKLLEREDNMLSWVVLRCVAAKARVVSLDERESNLREILNFGHTLGHTLESITGYRRFFHGEAVGWGMIGAAWLAAALGRLTEKDAARIIRLVLRIGPLPHLPRVSAGKILEHMRTDKKTRGDRLRFVLTRGLGQARTAEEVPPAVVRELWRELLKSGGRHDGPVKGLRTDAGRRPLLLASPSAQRALTAMA